MVARTDPYSFTKNHMSRQYEEATEPLSPSISWDPEEDRKGYIYLGEEVEGVYLGKKEDVGENHANIYTLEVEKDGETELYSLWGSMLLDSKFNEGNHFKPIPVGSFVKVVHLGTKPSTRGKGKTYHVFKVYFEPPKREMVEAGDDAEEAPASKPSKKAPVDDDSGY